MQVDVETLVKALRMVQGGHDVSYGRPSDFRAKHWQLRQKLTATETTLYGCCGLFSVCGPDALLSRVIIEDKFSTWIGWQENNDCYQFVKTLAWIGIEGTSSGSPQSAAGGPCDDPPSVEWGTCEYLIEKGLLRQCGQALDITRVGERYCDKQPIYTLDGQRINNDLEWQAVMAGQVLQAELNRLLIVGNKSNPGEFDGLEQLVNTGYVDVHTGNPCPAVDSIVVDWGGGVMNDSLIETVIAIIRRIRQRASRAGGIAAEDMVIMMPSFLRDCFMNAWVCYGICDENQSGMARWETRDRSEKYIGGGLFGDGYITVDGTDVSILVNDWIPVTQSAPYFCSDIYILTRRIGNLPVLYGQWMNMNQGAAALAKQLGFSHFTTSDGGRFIHFAKVDNLCIQTCTAMRPALFLMAPWAQARIDTVCCEPQGGLEPELPQPGDYFYGGSSPSEATCPETYFIEGER